MLKILAYILFYSWFGIIQLARIFGKDAYYGVKYWSLDGLLWVFHKTRLMRKLGMRKLGEL